MTTLQLFIYLLWNNYNQQSLKKKSPPRFKRIFFWIIIPAELRARYSKTIPTNYSRESSQNQANFVHTMSLRLLQMLNNHESSIKKSEFLEHLSTQENLTE